MRTTTFKLVSPDICIKDGQFDIVDEVYNVPTLPAYAILNHSLEYRSSLPGALGQTVDYDIFDGAVRIMRVRHAYTIETRSAVLTVYYAGIRDYSLLFPCVGDSELKIRLGQFAEEADNAFNAGSWMSFTLMAISAIEGLLLSVFGDKELVKLIDEAREAGALEMDEANLLHAGRLMRNRIHAGRFNEPLADRASGTDLYVLYDRLIKKSWDGFGRT